MPIQSEGEMLNRRRLLRAVPPFRPVAVKLLKLVDGPEQHLADIVVLLNSDAVICGELMRAANSPLFGSRYEIRSPLQALVCLGLDRVKALVVTTAMKALSDAIASKFMGACWRHNLATALICQKVSRSVRMPPEGCYVGGLIHDIGRLALSAVFPEYEDRMLAATGGQEELALERELFGLNHAEVGRWLLSQWGCPIEMQNIAAFHENPGEAPKRDRAIVSLVYAASQLADLMGMSALSSTEPAQLPAIIAMLSQVAGEEVELDFAELAEWVAIRVNGIELSLA